MGTYTTNYNLFMPTVGETGWGTLVNGNFEAIDAELKSLNNKLASTVAAINYTVTPDTTTYFYANNSSEGPHSFSITILPRIYGVTYTGSIQFIGGNRSYWSEYVWSTQNNCVTGLAGSNPITCSFTDASYFMITFDQPDEPTTYLVKIYGFTLEPNTTT